MRMESKNSIEDKGFHGGIGEQASSLWEGPISSPGSSGSYKYHFLIKQMGYPRKRTGIINSGLFIYFTTLNWSRY